jgi:putative oxidoreductase
MNDNRTDYTSSHPAFSMLDGVADSTRDLLLLIGRVMIGAVYVTSGWRKLMDIPAFVATMPGRGLPDWLGYVAAPVEFIGGVLLVLGLATRYAALVMVAFTVIATLSTHNYWAYPLKDQGAQFGQFGKNNTMTGGLILLFVIGAGRFCLDALLRRSR